MHSMAWCCFKYLCISLHHLLCLLQVLLPSCLSSYKLTGLHFTEQIATEQIRWLRKEAAYAGKSSMNSQVRRLSFISPA